MCPGTYCGFRLTLAVPQEEQRPAGHADRRDDRTEQDVAAVEAGVVAPGLHRRGDDQEAHLVDGRHDGSEDGNRRDRSSSSHPPGYEQDAGDQEERDYQQRSRAAGGNREADVVPGPGR